MKKVKNQGSAFFYCGEYDKCYQFFDKERKELKRELTRKIGGDFDLEKIKTSMEKFPILRDLCSSYELCLFMMAICCNNQEKFEEAKPLIKECN